MTKDQFLATRFGWGDQVKICGEKHWRDVLRVEYDMQQIAVASDKAVCLWVSRERIEEYRPYNEDGYDEE